MAMSKPRGHANLFVLLGEEEERDPMLWDNMPEFEQKTKHAPFTVMVRFRNKEDLDEFADLIKQPQLKGVSKRDVKSTWYPRLAKGEGGMDSSTLWVIDGDDVNE